ncbi:hypothetical protein [Snodgrassella sp. CS2]|uniref:hypothetical protein n=1 Tax=Snodgrassella sp. CS2 TaxID=3418953 RepID=UPI003D04EF05
MDSNIQSVIEDIYTVTKQRFNANDPLVRVIYSSLSLAEKNQNNFADILKENVKRCPEYKQLDNERLSMLPDILYMLIERFNKELVKFIDNKEINNYNLENLEFISDETIDLCEFLFMISGLVTVLLIINIPFIIFFNYIH